MVQTAVPAAVRTVHPARLAALVARVPTAAMPEMETRNIAVLAVEETAPQERTAEARLQTAALAVRTSPATTRAAVVVVLAAVLPELEEPAAVALAATVRRLREPPERQIPAAEAAGVGIADQQMEPEALEVAAWLSSATPERLPSQPEAPSRIPAEPTFYTRSRPAAIW
jgi:hypothetical protein